MKKFLSLIMALTIMLVPFQMNAFAMYPLRCEDHIEFVEINRSIERKQNVKKKLRIISATAAIVLAASIYAMNKYGSNGEFGSALGKTAANVVDFTKDQWDKINNLIESTPWLNEFVEKAANTFSMTKENMIKNISAFKCSYNKCGNILCIALCNL